MKLTEEQIQQLYKFTRQHYVEHYDVQTELVDHLANDIEHGFYSRGRQEELVEQIKAIDPNASIIWGRIERFEKQLEELQTLLRKQRESRS